MRTLRPDDPATPTTLAQWAAAIAESYAHETGSPLADPTELLDLPAVVLCHDTAADPVFVFANRTAQRLWNRSLADFLGMPSRLTAAPAARQARAAALDQPGLVRGYSGERITADGRLFQIMAATVWPVSISIDGERVRVGQAATFDRWTEPA